MKRHHLNLGLLGYGNVGSAVVRLLNKRKNFIRNKFDTEFRLKAVCDRSLHKKNTRPLGKAEQIKDFAKLLNDPEIDVVIELIGGLQPAEDLVVRALQAGKHVVTANKELLANNGKKLFREAKRCNKNIYYESAAGAGLPVIKTTAEGLAGNKFNAIYGLINGTSNYILTELTRRNLKFSQALKEAQKKGFAESDPTLDINGMDAAHKLTVLVYLALGKAIQLKNIHVEGITHISQHDIEYAERLNLVIKPLAIAKRTGNFVEGRVHPTLIRKEHPLASVNGIYNAVFYDTDPLGDVLLYGEGAGPMTAASGVVSDLINLAAKHGRGDPSATLTNALQDKSGLRVRRIDQIESEYYIRVMVVDKPGVMSKITGILGDHRISIASVTQTFRSRASTVPIVMLTHCAKEKRVRHALEQMNHMPQVKSQPVAIRMEELS